MEKSEPDIQSLIEAPDFDPEQMGARFWYDFFSVGISEIEGSGGRCLALYNFVQSPINDQLKNISQIEHSRHRSPINFCVNILCGLIAYCHQPKKPSLRLDWLLPQSA
jgi:hypothetical protein